ncbi:rhodanese-like domain-containing protein [Floridanema evergladense]|uniref:Rhodanese-like domain-containing protein n=1 Tax=Floridaenema evergladense BLCC-F167 TaxID=3153639 RepID=A0ABV4WTW9_9CYAN
MSRILDLIPNPTPLREQCLVYDLKARLDWGEPALTIIDVRDRNQFNSSHILGAVPMPLHQLVERALASLELNRDIYIYGETDEESAIAAGKLRAAGYVNVSQIRGGLPAWKAVGYPIEAIPFPGSFYL